MNIDWHIYGEILRKRKLIKAVYSVRQSSAFGEYVAERMRPARKWRSHWGSSFGQYAILKERKKRKKSL